MRSYADSLEWRVRCVYLSVSERTLNRYQATAHQSHFRGPKGYVDVPLPQIHYQHFLGNSGAMLTEPPRNLIDDGALKKAALDHVNHLRESRICWLGLFQHSWQHSDSSDQSAEQTESQVQTVVQQASEVVEVKR